MSDQLEKLIKKYNVPAPRYTSYPTVPFWEEENPDQDQWYQQVKRIFEESNQTRGISLYIHLPFCESLCTYCGCNKRITKNHAVEDPYIQSVLMEWARYQSLFSESPVLREIHLGGGTPTFFSPENLKLLVEELFRGAVIHQQPEFGFEGHPNNTTRRHLEILFESGFNRVSFGVQDFDEKIQRTINRIQPFNKVKEVTLAAREIGYQSVNYDLVYGLPFQTVQIIEHTIKRVEELMPERIAFYSYAHVPWKMPSQRGYSEKDLPNDHQKRMLYETGKEKLLSLGYKEIGMDHFALPQDTLYQAKEEGRLHRNFMGYTTSPSELMIGLGVSAISDAKYAYAQNLKKVEEYHEAIQNDRSVLTKGHFLTDEDLMLKRKIIELACNGRTIITDQVKTSMTDLAKEELLIMKDEGLVVLEEDNIIVTDLGLKFIRNICKLFDARLNSKSGTRDNVFSKAI